MKPQRIKRHWHPALAIIQQLMLMNYASPDGIIHSRGKYEHGTKKGPGRRRLHQSPKPAGHKLQRKFYPHIRNGSED